MSRIGKQPVIIPPDVDVEIKETFVMIKGTKGEISVAIPKLVKITKQDNAITVQVENSENHLERSLWGTIQRLLGNAITGVTNGFTKKLLISGVGYRAQMKDKALILEVGFTHPIEFAPQEGVTVTVEGTNVILVSGIDKQRVGALASRIRAAKKPEPYKGKGIAYEGEKIQRKAGKQAAGATK